MNRSKSSSPGPRRSDRKDAVANRQALLDAAARVFSEQGYKEARVRDICGVAGLNVGAINQHFGSKENLYREVIVRAGKSLSEQVACPRLEDFDSAEEALRAWMEYHLTLALLRRAKDPIAGPLLMREFRNPTEAMESFAELVIQPIRAELLRIIGALLGEDDSPPLRAAAANFVFGLDVFPALAGPMLKRLGQSLPTRKSDIDKLLNLMHPFVLGGIRALKDRPARS
ncbi:MAG: TetR/AcrR family transcriptional regulator [Planctomycetota bacterium]